jgi:hypothetical protein
MNDQPTEKDPCPDGTPGRRFWRTALLLAGSAAFGGLAVAFWNRKELAEMRSRVSEPGPQPQSNEEDIY